jgi:hypothetical protein
MLAAEQTRVRAYDPDTADAFATTVAALIRAAQQTARSIPSFTPTTSARSSPLVLPHTLTSPLTPTESEQLGWEPKYPGLIADLDEGHYFRTPSA